MASEFALVSEDDNDAPQLSTDTLALLQEFYDERDAQQKLLAGLESNSSAPIGQDAEAQAAVRGSGPLDMAAFAEDWNASQFWYTDSTADALAGALLAGGACWPNTHEHDGSGDAEKRGVAVAVVSAPSVFAGLKRRLSATPSESTTMPISDLALLEYDARFGAWPEFTPYDYNTPLRLPATLKGAFDAVILDPPFLNDDCQTKAALTVRWLARSWARPSPDRREGFRLIVCTGERMAGLVTRLYGNVGVRMTTFEICHAKNLANEFRCYANFEVEGVWRFVEDEQ